MIDLAFGGQGLSVNDAAEFGQDRPDLCHTSDGFGSLPCQRLSRVGLSSCCFFQTKAVAPFPRAGGLLEEAIIHFQEHFNLLEASFVLDVNVFPQYCDFCVREGCEPFCVAAWCH